MSEKTILVWFRNDLRIRDNEILLEAVRKADKVLPVYCFDPFYFKHNLSGNPKTGNIRARFLLESVANLRKNLQAIGGDLIIRIGSPAEIIPQLAEEYQVNEVYHHREVAHEETEISEQVETALWKIRLNLKHFIGHTLYHKEDLPFPIKDIPDSFAIFKKKVERDSDVRQCVATPEHIDTPQIIDAGELPTLQMLGLDEPFDDPRAVNHFNGGEDEAIKQLEEFFVNNSHTVIGKKNNNINLSKLSPWIALGCISLRQVYWEIIKHQQLNNTHYPGMLLDLLWRDYFRFMFKKHGQKFIAVKDQSGDVGADVINSNTLFEHWEHGETGVPLVDAIMHELNATGYISNHSRQLVALFLVNELKVDWKKGAAYFEEKLIDYSPASNWGNWAFIAGVNDARESRYAIAALPVAEQIAKNDYIETWLPAFNSDDYQAYAIK
ncbi:DASH family cryptochrome [Mucilaginibacter sp. BJC16-A38]|uniref:DASH family cryptochrome n=1 Tax=Mucilaginibacter phenanthrenivorans TaxID=1234842 RepID=UPI002157EBA8|nr:DASH family cryptochrome [Mucilaginibacter phenanthrenivorans]MCR8557921.1 DASH family cryptochrome [Mucilaginibacter phenanthrenivorans]